MNSRGNAHHCRRYWSAAGRCIGTALLLFTGLGFAHAQTTGEFDLLIYDTRGGETISITNTPGFGEFNADFSPNGKTVLYEVIEETFSIPPYLAVTDIETGNFVPFLSFGRNHDDRERPGLVILLQFPGKLQS